jgi:mono/diheme cytochrome c family protein
VRTIAQIVSAGAGDASGFAAKRRVPAPRRATGSRQADVSAAFFRMMRDRMVPRSKPILLAVVALALALALAACGEGKVEVPASNPAHTGAELFAQRCAGCHTLSAAGTHGSAANIRTRERTDGPNFNVRPECVERVLYAIENGGFSGAIMPANIVVGKQATDVAEFLATYAGKKATSRPPGTGGAASGFHCTSANTG